MSDQANKNTDKLDEFLKKAGKEQFDDDFEKEAAEGFATLGLNEAHELKAQTDRRVSSLFSYRKRKKAVQWSLAAGVMLFISMTVYLLRQDVSTENPKVAQTDISEKKEEIMPPPAPTIAPQAFKPAEEKPISTARPMPEPPPAELSNPDAIAAAMAENAADEHAQPKEDEIQQQLEMAAADKKAEATTPPARLDEEPNIAAGNAGAGRVASLTAPAEKSKSRAAKKSTNERYDSSPSAAQDNRSADDAPPQYLNALLRKKFDSNKQNDFSAMVKISEGVVSDVSFLSNGLTKSEKKEIEKILRELTVQELKPTGVANGEIKVDYRP